MVKGLTVILIRMASINRVASKWGCYLAGVLVAIMTAIILVQVFFRYALNNSFSWSEELAKILMVWSAFLVAPWAYRMGANASIAMLMEAFPNRFQQGMRLCMNLLVVWILVLFFGEAVSFWLRGFTIESLSMPVTMGWFYTVVPLGFLGLIIVGIEWVIRDFLSLIDPKIDYQSLGAGSPTGL